MMAIFAKIDRGNLDEKATNAEGGTLCVSTAGGQGGREAAGECRGAR